MKIMLSALENAASCKLEGSRPVAQLLVERGIKLKWNLMSYYYVKGAREELARYIRDHSDLVMIDSGAHSFQFGIKVDWVEYTKQYAKFIREFDKKNVVGFFEMDIENVIGYKNVLELRKILENETDKIIPVWHPIRGIDDYEDMCQKYSNRVIAIGGFKGTDIKDNQYLSFVKVAKKYGCKVHCLGMTRCEVLDRVPFDYTDSSSWSAQSRFGAIGQNKFKRGRVTKEYSRDHGGEVFIENYKCGIQMQEYYYKKWYKECRD